MCGGSGKKARGPLRVLVLGISGSGKSTFSKQMKILFTEGFNEDERMSFVNIIRANVLVGMKELAEQAFNLGLEIEEKHRKYVRYFKENNVFDLELSDQNVLKKVKSLWEDDAIQQAWEACRNYQIQVSQLDYLMENLDRITENSYIPNNEDIVRGRQRTAGAYSTRFTAFKYQWEIIDVGGQTPERKKWLNIVQQGFTSIIFFAALDEYNMESSETPGKTKMEVSMSVFEDIMNDDENFKCCNILFLNKIDLFREKILTKKGLSEFEDKFPEFKEYMGSNNVNEDLGKSEITIDNDDDKLFWGAVKFIEARFQDLIQDKERKNLVIYPTCAILTDQIKVVFNAMKDYIFVERMKDSGIRF